MPSMLWAMGISGHSKSGKQSASVRTAADSLLRVNCSDLLLGMYISELDCAWSETPFSVGGFHLKTAEDIETLSKHCKFVSIDTNKGTLPRAVKLNQLTILSSARRAVPASASLKINRATYPVLYPIKQQIDKSYRCYARLKQDFYTQAQAIRAVEEMDLSCLEKSIDVLNDEIVGNPQTLIWVLNTDPDARRKTDYCVRAAIWASILARQTGMILADLRALFMGTLLADIGMQLIPERLVYKRGPFSKQELSAYKRHVNLALEVVASYPQLDSRVTGIIRCHHERHDGLGFPRGLRGEQIPVLARFANLAYCFERLLKLDTDGPSSPPAKALSRIYKQRVIKFPQQLVVELIHVMGVYPLGSLVELSSGEVALVLEQKAQQKLSPKVAVLTDNNKSPIEAIQIVELGSEDNALESRIVVSSYRNADSSGKEKPGASLKPGNYIFSFCGRKIGIGALSLRL